jgi:hypothetical protein
MRLKWPLVIITIVIVYAVFVVAKHVNQTLNTLETFAGEMKFMKSGLPGGNAGGYGLGSFQPRDSVTFGYNSGPSPTSPSPSTNNQACNPSGTPSGPDIPAEDQRTDPAPSITMLNKFPIDARCSALPLTDGVPQAWGCHLGITIVFPNQSARRVATSLLTNDPLDGPSSIVGVKAMTALAKAHLVPRQDSHMNVNIITADYAQIQIRLQIPNGDASTLYRYVAAYDTLTFMRAIIDKVRHLGLDVFMMLTHNMTLVLSRYRYTAADNAITEDTI